MNIKTDVMGFKIRHNQRLSSKLVTQSMERLSTGLRINSASDDAAGLNIATRLKAFSNANSKGIENLQHGMNLFSTMESGISSIEDMVQRMRELIIQSKNGTISNSDRATIQQEINEITNGIEQISKSTTYNNMKVINNSLVKLDGINDFVEFGENIENVTSDNHSIEVTFTPNSTPTRTANVFAFKGYHHGIQLLPNNSVSFQTWFDNLSNKSITSPANSIKPGETYEVVAIVDNINRQSHLYINGEKIGSATFPPGATLYDYSRIYDGNLRLGIGNDPGAIYDYPYDGTIKEARIYNKSLSSNEVLDNFNGNTTEDSLIGEWISDDMNTTTLYDNKGNLNGTLKNGASPINEEISIRTGAQNKDLIDFRLTNVSAKSLGLYNLDINIPDSIKIVDKALDKLLSEHSRIGSTINSMSFRLDQLNTSQQTNSNALSSISSSDAANESSILTKEQIKMQTSLSMLQKNNANRENVITLLRT